MHLLLQVLEVQQEHLYSNPDLAEPRTLKQLSSSLVLNLGVKHVVYPRKGPRWQQQTQRPPTLEWVWGKSSSPPQEQFRMQRRSATAAYSSAGRLKQQGDRLARRPESAKIAAWHTCWGFSPDCRRSWHFSQAFISVTSCSCGLAVPGCTTSI